MAAEDAVGVAELPGVGIAVGDCVIDAVGNPEGVAEEDGDSVAEGVRVFDNEGDPVDDVVADGDCVSDGGHSWKLKADTHVSSNFPPVLPAKPIHAVPSPVDGAAARAPSMFSVVENDAEPVPIVAVHCTCPTPGESRHKETVACRTTPGAAVTPLPKVPALESGELTSVDTAVENPVGDATAPVVIVPVPPL